MIPYQVYYQLMVLGLLWLCVMLHYVWPSQCARSQGTPAQPSQPQHHRAKELKPFAGLTHKPFCAACAHDATHPQPPPPVPPHPIPLTNRRPRQVDTALHFCPHADGTYRGWLGLGNLRANGHPSGGPWRQCQCPSCTGYCLETHGTIFHGTRVAVELIVRVLACLAEGWGMRATARGFEVDPNTGLQWLGDAAEQLTAFTSYFLCDVHVPQLQLDELYTVLRGVKDGARSEQEAIERLSRSPHWVWPARDPESKVLLAMDVGDRTLAMTQRVVHQVVQVWAPGCIPLFLTDGFQEYTTALLTHCGYGLEPIRRQGQGPLPQPRWMPLPQVLYAQVVKQHRRRHLVGVRRHVGFGPLEAIEQVWSVCGWQMNTAFVERLNLDIRQRVAAVGRRVNTLCQGADGLQHQLVVCQAYQNFVLPHSSLRQPLLVPEPTNGTGSAKQWRPCTPAMAAGLTDQVWTRRAVLLYRVPPWPQPQRG